MYSQLSPLATAPDAPLSLWTEAQFPSLAMRAEFLDQVQTWNRIEDVQKIQTECGADATSLRYRCADYRRIGLRKLVGSYGGRITFESGTAARLESELFAAIDDWN